MRHCFLLNIRNISVLILFFFIQSLVVRGQQTSLKKPKLGVCYYPEHWPAEMMEKDAKEMKEIGLTFIRVGEFSWSTIEPKRNIFNWTFLDKSIDLLHKEGLKVVIGTPTATPPKWLIDMYGGNGDKSTVLPFGPNGRARKFGSRRHYSFSSEDYLKESNRIVLAMAKRYGRHPGVVGWQTDNEYGCHDTVRSYDTQSLVKFRSWLKKKYKSIDILNKKWGQAFWSADYENWDAIDLPHMTVTEAFPPLRFDFYRFSSAEVSKYNNEQTRIIRANSPGRWVTHNFMGFFFQFDHYDIMPTLDFATWDSYPLGFTDSTLSFGTFSDAEKIKYARTGHPDLAPFHHDLYSGVSSKGTTSFTGDIENISNNEKRYWKDVNTNRRSIWIMEQQPGPVNWAQHNPNPAPWMVRLWSWEAIAHGAEVVSYFRWRQAPFAQEQMHAGLHMPNNEPDIALFEAKQVEKEIKRFWNSSTVSSQVNEFEDTVALLFDYRAKWILDIQPQGKKFAYVKLVYMFYMAIRKLGLNVDIVSANSDLTKYKMIVAPSLPLLDLPLQKSIKAFIDQPSNKKRTIIFGPRTGSKTDYFNIPEKLAPGSFLQSIIPITVTRVESFRTGSPSDEQFCLKGKKCHDFSVWKEYVKVNDKTNVEITAEFLMKEKYEGNDDLPKIHKTSNGAIFKKKIQGGKTSVQYMALWPLADGLDDFIKQEATKIFKTGTIKVLEDGVRLRRYGNLQFCFNYNSYSVNTPAPEKSVFVLGGKSTSGHGVSIWTI